MLRLAWFQVDCLSSEMEMRFAERLVRHLEYCCPDAALPPEREGRIEYARKRIKHARKQGLTWQATIAEHARLFTLRAGGQIVPDPDALIGDLPATADARFADTMRRVGVLRGPERK